MDENQIKLLFLKKSLLGQYEMSFFSKTHETDLLSKGAVNNVDVVASAIKEAITTINAAQEKQVTLILPQESFSFLKADAPKDIAPLALRSFIEDKVKALVGDAIENSFSDYFEKVASSQKQINLFSIREDILGKYAEVLQLVGLKLVSLIPESLAYFKLFEKTLREAKKETIFYVSYESDRVSGYVFDSGGLVSQEKWIASIKKDMKLQDALKEKTKEMEEKGIKLQRIILSGEQSEKIRQDTFTKEVGVWTNPLKRIIPDFYQEYVKLLVPPQDKPFPILVFDACFGAFIFSQENKDFDILKKPLRKKSGVSLSFPKLPVSVKDFLVFIVSALATFGIIFAFSRSNMKQTLSNLIPKPKATPTPTKTPPTPTTAPEVKKEELKIKVLNGSGTAGKASEVKEVLQEAGYQEIVTDNADNFEYKKTVIRVKKSLAAAADVLKKDLEDSVTSPKIERLDEDETSDVVIIVGSDFK